MPSPDTDRTEEEMTRLLAEFDETLSHGSEAQALPGRATDLSPRDQAKLSGYRDVVSLLDRLWSEGSDARCSSEFSPPRGREPGYLGRFKLIKEIGRGGQGVVYLAKDPILDREVAVKVPHPGESQDPGLRARFLREARSAAELHHPNLVPVLDANELGSHCYLITPYCKGGSLRSWLSKLDQPLNPSTAARIVKQVASGVQYLHERGLLHRDIKPSNILLDTLPRGGVKVSSDEPLFIPRLTDFGLVRAEVPENGQTPTLALMGTPQYMAPEQADKSLGEVRAATDIHALGALLYELLTKKAAFGGASSLEILRNVAHSEPKPPSQINRQVPLDLDLICLKCLRKAPRDRYASAAQLAADLDSFLKGMPIQARPISPLNRAWRWMGRNPGTTALLATTSIALVALAAGSLYVAAQSQRHNSELQSSLRLQAALTSLAEKQRQVAEEREAFAQRLAYASRMRLAWDLLRDGQPRPLAELLRRAGEIGAGGAPPGFEWHYLRWSNRCDELFGTEHTRPVMAIATSFDGDVIATGSGDRTIRTWNPGRDGTRHLFRGHLDEVSSVAISRDGRWLVSASSPDRHAARGEVRLWSLQTGAEVTTPWPGGTCSGPVAFAPAGTRYAFVGAEAGGKRVLVVADTDQKWNLTVLPIPEARVLSMAFHPDGRQVFLGCSPESEQDRWVIRRVDLEKMESAIVAADLPPCWSIAIASDGRTLASGNAGGIAMVLDLPTGRERHKLRADHEHAHCVAISADSATLAVTYGLPSSRKSTGLLFWDLQTGKQKSAPSLPELAARAVAFDPSGELSYIGCEDGTVRAWRMDDRPLSRALVGHSREAWSVAFDASSRMLLTSGDDATIRLWEVPSGRQIGLIEGPGTLIAQAAFDLQGGSILSVDDNKALSIWDPLTGKRKAFAIGHQSAARCLALAPDGLHAATGSCDGEIKIWTISGNPTPRELGACKSKVRRLAFSPTGEHLYSVSEDRKLRKWVVANATLSKEAEDLAELCSLAISPDGRMVATGNRDGTVRLWDAESLDGSIVLPGGHGLPVQSLAFSVDGRTLASGGRDRTIRLWNTATGEVMMTFRNLDAAVNSVAFSGDGLGFAAAMHDGTVRLWRYERPPPRKQ